jgi:hypothetical protein
MHKISDKRLADVLRLHAKIRQIMSLRDLNLSTAFKTVSSKERDDPI